ncbi:MAG: methyltransferase domain-containing protein [Limnohabitans sp.]|jgi:malonyl-CoA O-methyltransferase|nr:methyltransferase domain-containing protein [Limnohabitans sp.]
MQSPESSTAPPTLDPLACTRWLDRARASSAWLHEEVGQRMADRLQWMRARPRVWLDWWPLEGGLQAHQRVQATYPQARAHWVERTPARARVAQLALQGPLWRRWLGLDPLQTQEAAPGQADLVWANMSLHQVANPEACLRAWHQALAVEGFLMFSCLGPDSLQELRGLYADLGWPPPAPAFTDMHDWGDMLVAAGFAEPVMDMERITLTYASPEALLAELRGWGRNVHPERFAALRGRGWRTQLLSALARQAQQSPDGRLRLTFEIIYGHALKAAPRAPKARESRVSLDDMRAQLPSRAPSPDKDATR